MDVLKINDDDDDDDDIASKTNRIIIIIDRNSLVFYIVYSPYYDTAFDSPKVSPALNTIPLY